MNNLTYTIELYDYWNTSSGLSGGALADTLCMKDPNNLPFLPGKTIKGLFREAAKTLLYLEHQGITPGFIDTVFGESREEKGLEEGGEKTQIATSFFTNASFNEATATAITQDLAPYLFEHIATTALESSGLAKKHALRRTEYALPCTLYGEILAAGNYKESLADCAAFIKRLGLNRHRGYGRCKITLL